MFKSEILGGDANVKTIIFFVLSLPLVLMFGGAGFAKMINAGGMTADIAGEFNLPVNFIIFIGAFSLFMANGDYGMTTHVIVLGFLCLVVAWGGRRSLVEFGSRGL